MNAASGTVLIARALLPPAITAAHVLSVAIVQHLRMDERVAGPLSVLLAAAPGDIPKCM